MQEYINDIDVVNPTFGIRYDNKANCYVVGFDQIYKEAFALWKADGAPSAYSNDGHGINLTTRIEWTKCYYYNKGYRVLNKVDTLERLQHELTIRQVNANAHQAKKHCKLVG
jgi:hypothetical protein